MLTGTALVPLGVPLCSCGRVQRLQGVAFTSSMSSTEWTACLLAASSMIRHCRPAVLLPCWALGAQPEDLLVALQLCIVRRVPSSCIALVIPLCQETVLALCKCWTLGLVFACILSTLRAASFFADAAVRCCYPLAATLSAVPTKLRAAVCDHVIRCSFIGCVVPLSSNQGSLGSQGIVLAYLTPNALRTPTA